MIIKKIPRASWKSLLSYIYEYCDEVLFTRRYNIWDNENDKLLKVILSLVDINENIYSIDYNILISNDEINKILKDEGVITNNGEYKRFYLCRRLEEILEWNEFEDLVSNLLKEHHESLVEKKDYYFEEEYMRDSKFYNFRYKTIYTFKLNEEMKNMISGSKSIYEWEWHKNIEDIGFKKNGKIWLYSIANRRLSEIFCENDEEVEYLKSLGIIFDENSKNNHPITLDDLAKL